MSVYYVFIVMPIIVMAVFTIIFQSSLTEIEAEQFMMNCPYPIFEGVATNVSIDSVFVDFDITHNKDINGNTTSNPEEKVGTYFECSHVGELLSVTTTIKEYGRTLFSSGIPYGWFGFAADYMTQVGIKAQAGAKLIYLYVNAPAEVTNLAFFSYINGILIGFIGFGAFMVARGNGG